MSCTTILVGRNASNDHSTMIARTDDGHFDVKKMIVVEPKKQPRKYKSVISHVEIELPDNPMRYTASPNVDKSKGIWAATGINEANVGMTATETITSNPRVLAADPLVEYKKAEKRGEKDVVGGIGEEDIVVLVLPYIHTAREGVLRLASLLEKYGTYESNGISFNDVNEVWWMETIGGHHWMAKRVPDDVVAINPNQFGMDSFDIDDAFGNQKAHMCSEDLREFIADNCLDLSQAKAACNQPEACGNLAGADSNLAVAADKQAGAYSNHADAGGGQVIKASERGDGYVHGVINPRHIFGSRRDFDHIYNTPRAWFMGRYLTPESHRWEGPDADFTPESDNIPWSFVPDKKVAVEDVAYMLAGHFQGTIYDPYSNYDSGRRGKYRSIGINRTGVTSICQIRSNVPEPISGVEWICFGSTTFSAFLPVYTNVRSLPRYLSDVKPEVSTENFYWASRLIDAMADHDYNACVQHIERYQNAVAVKGRQLLREYDRLIADESDNAAIKLAEEANARLCVMAKEQTVNALGSVLKEASESMRNGFKMSDN